jgi:hypothetical protein
MLKIFERSQKTQKYLRDHKKLKNICKITKKLKIFERSQKNHNI